MYKFFKKLILLFIVLLFFQSSKVSADMNNLEILEDISFFEYIPDEINENTPIIFAFHGIGNSYNDELIGNGKGTFKLYSLVYNRTIMPNAIIVYPTKYKGAWNISLISKFIATYLNENNLTGDVYYYGFSQGVFDGPSIIEACDGIFTGAIFVDGRFTKDYDKLTSLKKIYSIRGYFGDNDKEIDLFNNKCIESNIYFKDLKVNLSHAKVNEYAVISSDLFDFVDFKDNLITSFDILVDNEYDFLNTYYSSRICIMFAKQEYLRSWTFLNKKS